MAQIPEESRPAFDLVEFMNFSHETRISSEALEALNDRWQDWTDKIEAEETDIEGAPAIFVSLPAEIERDIDATWERSPSEGFMLNNLAQYLCMAAVAELVPEVSDLGCAPSPPLSENLAARLAHGNSRLPRFSVLTFKPFRGGCEICSLKQGCPRLTGQMDAMTAVLPGHETGDDA